MLKLLTNLSLHYPQAGHSPAQMMALAEDWAEDFAAYPLQVVQRAVTCARRECLYFPSTAKLLELCRRADTEFELYQQSMRLDYSEDPNSPENRARGLKGCEAILKRIRGQSASNFVTAHSSIGV
jgi:hypothetical protein